ncbi:MAG: methyltransferase domain-containing protein [Planctomycetota bacterium]
MLTEKAKNALACPYCRIAVEEKDESLACSGCGRKYPLIRGIPHMLDAQEIKERSEEWKAWKKAEIRPPISYGLLQKIKSPAVHVWPDEKRVVKHLLEELPDNALVLDIGSGATVISDRITRLDLGPFHGIDIVGDGHALPFRDSSVDLVFIFRVLEHMRRPEHAVGEIFRILKPGGRVAAVIPFFEPFHINPIDISRFTRDGVRYLFSDFDEERIEWCVGPSAALAWMLKEWVATVFPGSRSKWIYVSVRELAGWFFAPLRIIDRFLRGKPYAHKIAESFFYQGRKQAIEGERK